VGLAYSVITPEELSEFVTVSTRDHSTATIPTISSNLKNSISRAFEYEMNS